MIYYEFFSNFPFFEMPKKKKIKNSQLNRLSQLLHNLFVSVRQITQPDNVFSRSVLIVENIQAQKNRIRYFVSCNNENNG